MALDQFLKLTGIKGESKDKVHHDEIDVLSWSWGSSQSGAGHSGTGSGAGKVNVGDLSITKPLDLSSPVLFGLCATGKHIPEATLTVRKAGDKPLEYLIITMKQLLVTSYQTGGSGGEDALTENVTFNFAELKKKYTAQNADGSAGAAPEFNFSVIENAQK